MHFARGEVPSSTAHRCDTSHDENNGEETEDQDVEHDPLDHGNRTQVLARREDGRRPFRATRAASGTIGTASNTCGSPDRRPGRVSCFRWKHSSPLPSVRLFGTVRLFSTPPLVLAGLRIEVAAPEFQRRWPTQASSPGGHQAGDLRPNGWLDAERSRAIFLTVVSVALRVSPLRQTDPVWERTMTEAPVGERAS